MYWTSYKATRVNRSVLRSEIMALADSFDIACVIKQDLHFIKKSYTPLNMMTDSLLLFDVMMIASSTTEKPLNIDFQTVEDSY